MSSIRFIIASLLVTVVHESAAQTSFPPDAAIKGLLDERVAHCRVAGIVLATRDAAGQTKIFTAGTTGRNGVELNGDTLFEIGSITKTVTATLLAEMVARGEIRLDDAVQKYLPAEVILPRQDDRQITFLDLATHTSALPGQPANIAPENMSNPYADYTVTMLDEFLADYTLPRSIGAKYEYSAVGFGLLGRALGQRLRTSWEQAAVDRVLTPLGMTSTRATLSPELRRRLAPGHDEACHEVPNWDIPALPAMGALRSSARDMLKYLAANMDPASRPLGKACAMSQAPRVDMDDETQVGLAWQTGHATNREIVWHGGGTGGYRALLAFDPGQGLGVVVLTNSSRGADDIGFHLLDATLPLDAPWKNESQ